MFGISLIEFLTIIIIAIIIIKPSEYPNLIKKLKKFYRDLKKTYNIALAEIDKLKNHIELSEETSKLKEDINNLDRDIKKIVGDDGELYDSYDISDIIKKNDKN